MHESSSFDGLFQKKFYMPSKIKIPRKYIALVNMAFIEDLISEKYHAKWKKM